MTAPVPRRISTARNESGEPASMLLMFHPGAPREEYFEGLVTVGELSEEERRDFFARHDNFWVEVQSPRE